MGGGASPVKSSKASPAPAGTADRDADADAVPGASKSSEVRTARNCCNTF